MPLIPTDPAKAQIWVRGDAPNQVLDVYVPRGARGEVGPVGPVGPSVGVGQIVTTAGPAAPGTVGAQGLTGPKGDPGGWVVSSLANGTNLNNVTTPGLYYPLAGADITSTANYPVNGTGGYLEVVRWSAASPNYVIQTYHVRGEGGTANHVIGSRGFYRRVTNDAVSWSKWSFFGPQRVDQTAGRAIYQWDDLNNREQLVYGDTGWRTIVSWDTAGVVTGTMPTGMAPQAGMAGAIYLRREGNTVTLSVHGLVSTAATQEMNIPVGFQPGAPYPALLMYCVLSNGTITSGSTLVGASVLYWSFPTGTLVARGSTTAFGSVASWSTTQTWPTVLPGTAYGTIPNV